MSNQTEPMPHPLDGVQRAVQDFMKSLEPFIDRDRNPGPEPETVPTREYVDMLAKPKDAASFTMDARELLEMRGNVAVLRSQVDRLESLVRTQGDEVAKLRRYRDWKLGKITSLEGQLNSMKGRIKALEEAVKSQHVPPFNPHEVYGPKKKTPPPPWDKQFGPYSGPTPTYTYPSQTSDTPTFHP